MIVFQNVKYALGFSNIKFANNLSKNHRKALIRPLSNLERVAKDDDVFVKFSSDNDKLKMEVKKSVIKHVTDIPNYAMKHNTGDSVYVSIKSSSVTEFSRFPTLYNLYNSFSHLSNVVTKELQKLAR